MSKLYKLSLKRLLLSNPWGFALPLFIGVIASLAGIALLGISGWFLSAAGLAGVMGVAKGFNYFTPGALVRLMAILRTAGRYGEQVFAHDHLLGLLKTLRVWIWDTRVAKDSANLHQQSRGDLLQRLVADVDQIIRWPLVVLMPWVYALLAYLSVMILASFISSRLLVPIGVAAIVHLLVVPFLCGQYASHSVHVGQILGTHRRSRFVSLFSALITLTIRGHWQDYAERLNELDTRQKRAEQRIQKAISVGRLASYAVTIALLTSFFVLLMQYNAATGAITLLPNIDGAWLVALVLSILAVNELVLPLAQSFVAQGQSQVGLKRLNQLNSTSTSTFTSIRPPNIHPPKEITTPNSLAFSRFRGTHPASGLGNKPVSFNLNHGDILWLKGPSGCGKSSLLAALAGELPTQGKVNINGEELENLYGNASYQNFVSYLPQSPYVFQQSVAANLRLGAPAATDNELMQVLDAVALGDWVRSLPNGLDTLLGAQGRDLSGGQRRRLALARLLLRHAPILLLDEPFDGLDKDTINSIIQSIRQDYKADILVFVSHIETALGDSAKILAL